MLIKMLLTVDDITPKALQSHKHYTVVLKSVRMCFASLRIKCLIRTPLACCHQLWGSYLSLGNVKKKMSIPEYIRKIEDSPVFQYQKTMAINRCMADYAHVDDASRGKLCLDKLGYYIVTQPHMSRAMKMEQSTGGALNTESFKFTKQSSTTIFILLVFVIIALSIWNLS